MPSFNRAQARKDTAAVGKALGGHSGNYWHVSKQEEGRYVLRVMPPHPQKNPEGIVFRPLHFIGDERMACNTWAPEHIWGKLGPERIVDGPNAGRPSCMVDEVANYYGDLKENNPVGYEMELSDKKKRDMVEDLRPKGNTHVFALLIEEKGVQHIPPQPKHVIITATSVIEAIDENGLGKDPMIAAELTDYNRGRNFIFEKKSNSKYGTVQWDVWGTSLATFGVTQEMWMALMSVQYPNLADTDVDRYKSYQDQEKTLRSYGLVV